jgi:hypothetical protein
MGLEVSDFEPPRPLAFCRDLVRGGKPQFFFEMESRMLVDDLERKGGAENREYITAIQTADTNSTDYSPELLAFPLLTLQD